MSLKSIDMGKAERKWKAHSADGAPDYVRNTVAAAPTYGANTGAAEQAYRSGVSGAGVSERFARNARGKGQAKFARKVQAVGESRFSEGVNASGSDYVEGFAPYVQVMQGLSLGARGPRGSAGNKARSNAVQDALHARRVGTAAAGR